MLESMDEVERQYRRRTSDSCLSCWHLGCHSRELALAETTRRCCRCSAEGRELVERMVGIHMKEERYRSRILMYEVHTQLIHHVAISRGHRLRP